MKKFASLVFCISVITASSIFAQKGNLLLNFSATDFYSNDTLTIDSVFVNNESQSCDTTIYGPSAELLLLWPAGVDEFTDNEGFSLKQNHPNPFLNSTKCEIVITTKSNAKLKLVDSKGKRIASLKRNLSPGIHTFTIETGKSGVYYFIADVGKQSKTIKLISQSRSNNNVFSITHTESTSGISILKESQVSGVFSFQPGDLLSFTVYTYGYEDYDFFNHPEADTTFSIKMNPHLLEFTGDSVSGYVPLATQFLSVTNIPNISNWSWDFGDGETSNLSNPSHIYTTPDTWYTVSLTVTSGTNAYTTQKMHFIHAFADTTPINFIADYTHGIAPQVIHFTGYQNTPNGTWQWSFGDGGTAQYVSDPVYTYLYPGDYTVTASFFTNNGQTTVTKENYIHIDFCPVTITDDDGNVYNGVKIENQCWMKENLNTGVQIMHNEESLNNGIVEKYCYNDDPSMCDEYGGWYDQFEYLNYIPVEGAQGICPDGWHIPTKTDCFILINNFGGQDSAALALKEEGTAHWNSSDGTNLSGFTAFGEGYVTNNGSCHLKSDAIFASSNENSNMFNCAFYFYDFGEFVHYSSGSFHNNEKISVRCIKDQ